MENQQRQEQQGSDKIQKEFDTLVSQVIALFKGPEVFKKEKVKNSDTDAIVEELLAERKKAFNTTFKTKLGDLLNSKMEFEKVKAAAEKELKDKVTNQQKKFIEEAKNLFKMVENIKDIEKSYKLSLSQVTEAVKQEEVTGNQEETN